MKKDEKKKNLNYELNTKSKLYSVNSGILFGLKRIFIIMMYFEGKKKQFFFFLFNGCEKNKSKPLILLMCYAFNSFLQGLDRLNFFRKNRNRNVLSLVSFACRQRNRK